MTKCCSPEKTIWDAEFKKPMKCCMGPVTMENKCPEGDKKGGEGGRKPGQGRRRIVARRRIIDDLLNWFGGADKESGENMQESGENMQESGEGEKEGGDDWEDLWKNLGGLLTGGGDDEEVEKNKLNEKID